MAGKEGWGRTEEGGGRKKRKTVRGSWRKGEEGGMGWKEGEKGRGRGNKTGD